MHPLRLLLQADVLSARFWLSESSYVCLILRLLFIRFLCMSYHKTPMVGPPQVSSPSNRTSSEVLMMLIYSVWCCDMSCTFNAAIVQQGLTDSFVFGHLLVPFPFNTRDSEWLWIHINRTYFQMIYASSGLHYCYLHVDVCVLWYLEIDMDYSFSTPMMYTANTMARYVRYSSLYLAQLTCSQDYLRHQKCPYDVYQHCAGLMWHYLPRSGKTATIIHEYCLFSTMVYYKVCWLLLLC